MLVDLLRNPEGADTVSDVCIVGAGAAGIPLARELARHGCSVTLLESGGLDYEQATQDLYRGANVGMAYYELENSRLRFFGGTTRIWGGRCALLDPIDFQARDWVPHSGWPIDLTDLEPHYHRAHAFFELDTFDYGPAPLRERGATLPGFDPGRITTRLWRFDERHERFGPRMCRDVLDSDRICVLLHANVVHLQANADATAIDSLVIRTLGQSERTVRARHFVLAGGAIENARLLLASRDVETGGVGNRFDQVGRYFMEHPNGRLARVHVADPYAFWMAMQKRFRRLQPPVAPVLALADSLQRQERTLNSVFTFKLQRRNTAKGATLTQQLYSNIKHAINADAKGRALNHAYRNVRAWTQRRVRNTYERLRSRAGLSRLYMMVRGEQAPNPASRIVLSSQRDALGVPLADLNWQLSAIDKHAARVLVHTFDAELRRLGLGCLEPFDWLRDPGPQWPVDASIGNHPIAGYHHMGTTRMSDDPRRGVVDANCRVHGYANLFVAGSSVFPTSGWANPTLTIVALSYRLAEHLRSVLRVSS
ncbi:MAG: GMC family oxidoreductase [Pseudomonadales bacterium]